MKRQIARTGLVMQRLVLVTLSLATGLAFFGANSEAQEPSPRYTMSILSTLGGALSSGSGINNKGWVVGDSNLVGNENEHAALWRDGVITDLGTLGGPNSSIGFIGARPNDTGLITGNAQSSTVDPLGEYWGVNFGCNAQGTNGSCQGWQYLFLGFSWKHGVMTELPPLGGNNSAALGRANQRSEMPGTAETVNPDPSCIAPQVLDWVPVVWEPNGKIRQLPLFPGDSVGAASAINDEGQAVGGTGFCATPGTAALAHAVLWQNGMVMNLGSLGGVINNFAVSINNRGQVSGLSDLAGDATSHGFFWQNGMMTDLGTLPGDYFSLATEINDNGQVVGQSCDVNFNCTAFVWENGVMTDLNRLVPTGSSFYLIYASGINSRGQIVGMALDQADGAVLGFVATPCDGQETVNKGCEGAAEVANSAVGMGETSKIVLPENVRQWLRQRSLKR